MDVPVSGLMRWGRAAVLAAVALTAGLVAHESAGGLLPGPGWLAGLYLCCLLAAARLLGRPASTARVVVLLVLGQTFIHLALTALAGHRGDPPLRQAGPVPSPVHPAHPALGTLPTDASGRRIGSLLDQMQALQPQMRQPMRLTVPAPIEHLIVDFTGPHAVMAFGHLVATAVVGWWLARGERLLWTVVTLTSARLQDASAAIALLGSGQLSTLAPAAPGTACVRTLPSARRSGRGTRLEACAVRRGPPGPVTA